MRFRRLALLSISLTYTLKTFLRILGHWPKFICYILAKTYGIDVKKGSMLTDDVDLHDANKETSNLWFTWFKLITSISNLKYMRVVIANFIYSLIRSFIHSIPFHSLASWLIYGLIQYFIHRLVLRFLLQFVRRFILSLFTHLLICPFGHSFVQSLVSLIRSVHHGQPFRITAH